MGWETRKGHRYYYGKQRTGNRVRSVYLGGGKMVGPYIGFATDLKIERTAEREKELEKRTSFESIDAEIKTFSTIVKKLTDAVLTGAGFHQHKRQWRKRRR